MARINILCRFLHGKEGVTLPWPPPPSPGFQFCDGMPVQALCMSSNSISIPAYDSASPASIQLLSIIDGSVPGTPFTPQSLLHSLLYSATQTSGYQKRQYFLGSQFAYSKPTPPPSPLSRFRTGGGVSSCSLQSDRCIDRGGWIPWLEKSNRFYFIYFIFFCVLHLAAGNSIRPI